MSGKLLPQMKTMAKLGEAPKRRGNEIDLFYVGPAMGTGYEMQADTDFGQNGKAVVQIC
jgi:hypothetical protein